MPGLRSGKGAAAMHVSKGDPPTVGADTRDEGALGTDHKEWPLGRMVAVVFIVCLVVWGFIIISLLDL